MPAVALILYTYKTAARHNSAFDLPNSTPTRRLFVGPQQVPSSTPIRPRVSFDPGFQLKAHNFRAGTSSALLPRVLPSGLRALVFCGWMRLVFALVPVPVPSEP
jgi:hypothetical protein